MQHFTFISVVLLCSDQPFGSSVSGRTAWIVLESTTVKIGTVLNLPPSQARIALTPCMEVESPAF